MPITSAGILLYKKVNDALEFMLVHPGGPFWKNKDLGTWTIPKGEFTDGESAFDAACREFTEETGFTIDGECIELQPVRTKSNKIIFAWACNQDIDPEKLQSNTFEMEWPPKSGNRRSFPEIDRAAWFNIENAFTKIHPAQINFIKEVQGKLSQQ